MRSLLIPLALASLVPAAVRAQQPGDTVHLPPVVITATRLPTPANAAPEAVTVLEGTDLRAAGITTVAEALRDVPGAAIVQTGSFGGATSLFLRGGQSNYVKVLVDGVPVNQPGGSFDFANLTTDNVERIEVLRGPASVLYGSDAVTGVVQIVTRRGTGPRSADVSLSGGTYGSLNWGAELAGGSERASYSFATSALTTDGTYAFNNRYRNSIFSGLLHVAPDDRSDATLTLRYGDDVYHFPTSGGGVPKDRNQFNYGGGPALGLDVGHRLGDRVEARLLLASSEVEGGYDNRPDSTADSSVFRSLDNIRRSSADVRANVTVRSRTVVTTGVAVEQEHDRSLDVCATRFGDCSSPPVDTSRWNRAAYAQAVAEVARRISLTTGARLEDNQRFGTFVTYRLGAVLRVASNTRLRATAGNAFREPSFLENYSTGYAVGNPDLRPERSSSWEVAVEERVARGHVSLSATYFAQRFRDMIDYNPAAPFGTPNYANVAGASANGVELGIHAARLGPLWLGLSYTHLATNVTNTGFDSTSGATLAQGKPLIRRPEHSGRLDATYRGARGAVSLAVTYVGERWDQDFSTFPFPRVTLPPYARVDGAAQWDVVRRGTAPGLGVSARIENLLDHAYEEVKNFPARRRTVFVGARLGLAY